MTDQSPAELEQDAERVRAQIADTAEHLKDKMSPGQLMDEVVNYLKDGDASQFMTNLKTQVRDNPLSLAMIGGGLAWLMMGSGVPKPGAAGVHRSQDGVRSGPRTYGTASVPASTGIGHVSPEPHRSRESAVGDGKSSAGDGAPGLGQRVSDTTGSVSAAMGAASESVGHTVQSAGDTLREGMHEARDAATERLSSAADAGADLANRARTTFLDVLEREPLVLGAIGVAVGAAIGAMLPATRVEQEYLGQASADARQRAGTAVAEGIETARHAAADAYSAARDEADRQGLMPGGEPIAERVAAVAKAAGEELKSAKDQALHGGEKPSETAQDREGKIEGRAPGV